MPQKLAIRCPHCRAAVTFESRWAGMPLDCPHCRKTFTASKRPPAPAPGPTSAPPGPRALASLAWVVVALDALLVIAGVVYLVGAAEERGAPLAALALVPAHPVVLLPLVLLAPLCAIAWAIDRISR